MIRRKAMRLWALACVTVLIGPYGRAVAVPPITIFVDGQQLMTDVSPFIMDGRTMVPLRPLLERLGARIRWDAYYQTVRADTNAHWLYITVGSPVAIVDDIRYRLDVPPLIRSGRTFLPARFVAEAFGASVTWNSTLRRVTIWTTAPSTISQAQLNHARSVLTPYVRKHRHNVYLSLPSEGVPLFPSVMRAVSKEMTDVNQYVDGRILNRRPDGVRPNQAFATLDPMDLCAYHQGECEIQVVESFASNDWRPSQPLHTIQGGNMDFRTYWWGFEWYWDDLTTRRVVAALYVVIVSASGTMMLLKLLEPIFPQATAGAVAVHAFTGLILLGTEVIKFCNVAGNGVVIRITFGVPHCEGRD
jgi:hypothetical protein